MGSYSDGNGCTEAAPYTAEGTDPKDALAHNEHGGREASMTRQSASNALRERASCRVPKTKATFTSGYIPKPRQAATLLRAARSSFTIALLSTFSLVFTQYHQPTILLLLYFLHRIHSIVLDLRRTYSTFVLLFLTLMP